MYIKHPDSIPLELHGITCHVPPVGKVYDRFSGKWVDVDIKARSSKKKDQYWERDVLPDWYNKRRREEEKIILDTEDKDFFIEECEEVRRQWWFNRINGQWFYNNGEPTYITGLHWFYLNCWPIDVGYPRYFDYDRLIHYHRQYCIDDPLCFGQLEIGPRRGGKTYKAGCFVYEATSRSGFSLGGIQSKTGPDAKKVFSKAIVSQFRKIPHFFKPVYDKSQGTIPKSGIRFFNTSEKGKKPIDDYEKELESEIDYRSSGKFAYDGEKTLRLLHDEIFKTEEVDVYERYNVVKECLMDPATMTIVGKYLGTSTVEEVEGHLETYENMWKDSDPSERDANGHTTTGLYRYFTSAARTRNLDKYGNCNVDENTTYILNTVEGLKKDPKKASDYRRKYPLSIRDAFRPKATDCHYNIELLEDRYDLLAIMEPKYVTGNFRWNDPKDKRKGVRFVESKNGPVKLHKDIDYNWGGWNNVRWFGSTPSPANKSRFVLGCDPYDHKSTVDGRKSDGAGTVFYKMDPMNMDKSDKFVMVYCHRPKKPSIFYEDMLKACWFFGCQMLFEDNKQGIRTYFDVVDCSRFLLHIDGRKEPGIPATHHESIVNHTEEYIDDCIDRVDFPELVSDWMKFDITKTTKYDVAMSSGYTLMAADRISPTPEDKEPEMLELEEVFAIY